MAVKKGLAPREIGAHIRELQQTLLRDDCYIPGVKNLDEKDLLRKARASATHSLPGCEAEKVFTGVARAVGEESNCWAAYAKDHPELTLRLSAPAAVKQVALTFDSNLSREITISINRDVLARQSEGLPPELVRACSLIFELEGKIVCRKELDGLSQRHCIVCLDHGVCCDTIRIGNLQTYGAGVVRIFEARAYAES